MVTQQELRVLGFVYKDDKFIFRFCENSYFLISVIFYQNECIIWSGISGLNRKSVANSDEVIRFINQIKRNYDNLMQNDDPYTVRMQDVNFTHRQLYELGFEFDAKTSTYKMNLQGLNIKITTHNSGYFIFDNGSLNKQVFNIEEIEALLQESCVDKPLFKRVGESISRLFK